VLPGNLAPYYVAAEPLRSVDIRFRRKLSRAGQDTGDCMAVETTVKCSSTALAGFARHARRPQQPLNHISRSYRKLLCVLKTRPWQCTVLGHTLAFEVPSGGEGFHTPGTGAGTHGTSAARRDRGIFSKAAGQVEGGLQGHQGPAPCAFLLFLPFVVPLFKVFCCVTKCYNRCFLLL
jgi:hypothetical protein